jgi:acyl-CoA synthetase
MLMGSRVVLQEKFEVKEAIALMNREGCTYSMGATTFFYDILNTLEETGASLLHLRFYLCGGAPVPSAMVQRGWQPNIRRCEVYGSTESTPHVFVPPEEALERKGTVSGRPIEGVEVRVVDQNGNDVPDGQEGEEWSRGPNVFVGYTSGSPSGASLDEDGWFHSGDLCVRGADGYLRITGRVKDIIIRGGENLNANQLNDNLSLCPALAEHTVIGIPDDRLGERICAVVVLKEGASLTHQSLLDCLQSHQIPKWQWPERLEIVSSLPKTDSGKIQKFKVKQEIDDQIKAEQNRSF